jgi:hypothetical protein
MRVLFVCEWEDNSIYSTLNLTLINSPRYGEPSDEVRLRGEPKLVQKLKGELEKAVVVLKDRVVLGVEIPAAQHRALIGRGGQHLTEFQTRLGVQVQFPGSRTYAQTGQPDNAADLENADPGSIVKVSGPSKACETAIEELKVRFSDRPADSMNSLAFRGSRPSNLP